MNRIKITGYVKEVKLVDINGKSLGESPHYSLQIIYPIQNEIYISDNSNNLREDILYSLYKIKYLKNISDYEVIMDDNFIINVSLKEEIYA